MDAPSASSVMSPFDKICKYPYHNETASLRIHAKLPIDARVQERDEVVVGDEVVARLGPEWHRNIQQTIEMVLLARGEEEEVVVATSVTVADNRAITQITVLEISSSLLERYLRFYNVVR